MKDEFKYRPILLYLSLCSGIMGLIVKLLYRPWIVTNNINDFGINGFAPNFIYTIGICLFASFFVKRGQIKAMVFVAIGVLVYEAEQFWTSRTFDYLDILATIIGLGAAIFIYKLITSEKKSEHVEVLDK
jgi:hypothetical protein